MGAACSRWPGAMGGAAAAHGVGPQKNRNYYIEKFKLKHRVFILFCRRCRAGATGPRRLCPGLLRRTAGVSMAA